MSTVVKAASEGPYPVKPGDWVERDSDLRVGRVSQVYMDTFGNEGVLINVVFYTENGECVGRISEPLGGPTRCEPAVPFSDFRRIEKPNFPLNVRLAWVPNGDGKLIARRVSDTEGLANREWIPKTRTRKPVPARVVFNNYDPLLEERARRMAAQSIRDIAKETGNHELIKEAERLEKEAAEIAKGN